jgi:hypothetical protein
VRERAPAWAGGGVGRWQRRAMSDGKEAGEGEGDTEREAGPRRAVGSFGSSRRGSRGLYQLGLCPDITQGGRCPPSSEHGEEGEKGRERRESRE